MKTAALKVRFTIERKSAPLSRRRFLTTGNDGGKIWSDGVDVFLSREAATAFVDQRMGRAASDAVVVRHTLH